MGSSEVDYAAEVVCCGVQYMNEQICDGKIHHFSCGCSVSVGGKCCQLKQ